MSQLEFFNTLFSNVPFDMPVDDALAEELKKLNEPAEGKNNVKSDH